MLDHDREIASAANGILAAKLALREHLPAGYVHDPAVVFLLTLFLGHVEGKTLFHRQVCDAAIGVSLEVSTRWLKALESDGLVTIGNATEGGDPEAMLTKQGLATVRDTVMAVRLATRAARHAYTTATDRDAQINWGGEAAKWR